MIPETHLPTSAPLVRLDRVYAGHGDRMVFSGASFTVYPKERLVLVGPNGAGKSTLLGLLHGDVRPCQNVPAPGRVVFGFEGTEDTSPLCARQYARLVSPATQARYVRQGWRISGEEVILSGLDNAAMLYGEPAAAQRAAAGALAEAAGAELLLGLSVPAMSQGQLRLVLILRALMAKPALLLLDEPFDGLDAVARRTVNRLMDLAWSQGSALVLAVHRAEDVPVGVSGVVAIRDGVLSPCPVEELSGRFAVAGSSPALPSLPQPETAVASSGVPREADALLRLEHVDVFIDRAQVLFDVNLTVRPGEQWLISGANGSGKSTLLRLVYGEEFAAFGGTMLWKEGSRPPLEELRREVGYVSDRLQQSYDGDLTVEETILSGRAGTVGLHRDVPESERIPARLWMRLMDLEPAARRPLRELSSGMMRRVFLARALAFSPALLLLDEPCSGLDARSRALFLGALSVLAGRGVQLLYVSHNGEERSPLFTHELRLERGRVVFAGERRIITD